MYAVAKAGNLHTPKYDQNNVSVICLYRCSQPKPVCGSFPAH